MNRGMLALIRKDLRSVTANHRMLVTLLVVPLVLTVFLPTVAVVTLHTAPEEAAGLSKAPGPPPGGRRGAGHGAARISNLLLNYVLPLFFLIIPVMTASVMASASFVGEREKHTLETLLYGPLSLRQVFRAKVLAAFTLSMGVSLLSFGIMLAVFEGEVLWLTGQLLAPAPCVAAGPPPGGPGGGPHRHPPDGPPVGEGQERGGRPAGGHLPAAAGDPAAGGAVFRGALGAASPSSWRWGWDAPGWRPC